MTTEAPHRREQPALGFWQIWNLCFGFLGIQFGFALQNTNVSRIFQTLGAEIDTLPLLWLAGPVTGLVVQPIVGYMSDRTWGWLGRRRPYFFVGALLTTAALVVMPNAPVLWVAAGTLWVLDASINITMEPFRAFVGDSLPARQRSTGYVMQSFFISAGAVVASALPWIMANWLDVANVAAPGEIPDSVRYSFYLGAFVLCAAVMWTVASSREYSPAQLAAFAGPRLDEPAAGADAAADRALFRSRRAGVWLVAGGGGLVLAPLLDAGFELYLIAAGAVAFGALQGIATAMQRSGRTRNAYFDLCRNLVEMPITMRRLAWVQFFSWFALFSLWIYATPAITQHHFGATDTASVAYNAGADWVAVLFASYNAFAVVAAMVIPLLIRRVGLKRAHQINLLLGALGLSSILVIRESAWLLAAMVGVGFAWASIVSIPYALLANALPAARMGVFMGIFNFFIVIPQLLAAVVLGGIVVHLFGGQPIYALLLGGAALVAAAVAVRWVPAP